MHGYGLFTWPDGKKYKGMYEEDNKSGYGEFYWPDGKVYKGEWKDGSQSGEGELFSNGTKIKGIWFDGKMIEE